MILVIGLGSMGKRRIRCLQNLGYRNIMGMDTRQDRRNEAKQKYGIDSTEKPENITHVFICLPPKLHKEYSDKYRQYPTFIEAGTERLSFGTPSATMLFNPMVRHLEKSLPDIGKFVNASYHCGQYLPDWHKYEKVSDFYAAEAGALEMVAFELMWFCRLFGIPDRLEYSKRKGTHIEGLKAVDTYAMILDYGQSLASIMIDVVARQPIRQLVVNGTDGQLAYNLNEGVSESMYVNETKAFMDSHYPNTLDYSNRIIGITQLIK